MGNISCLVTALGADRTARGSVHTWQKNLPFETACEWDVSVPPEVYQCIARVALALLFSIQPFPDKSIVMSLMSSCDTR